MEATEPGGHADEHSGHANEHSGDANEHSGHAADWLAGAMIEFGGEIEEPAQVALDGIEFGSDDETHVA
jgi:hypothetical protein